MLELLGNINVDQNLIYVAIRTVVIYLASILFFRIANTRFKIETAFDFILPIIAGSVLSRSMNGSASLISGIVAFGVLVFLHWLFAYICFKYPWGDRIIKGTSSLLYNKGKIRWKNMKKHQITLNDLLEECERQTNQKNLFHIEQARLGSTGHLIFIRKS